MCVAYALVPKEMRSRMKTMRSVSLLNIVRSILVGMMIQGRRALGWKHI